MKIKDKVLIVEDEQSISNFISMILTANGFDTIIVRSGEASELVTEAGGEESNITQIMQALMHYAEKSGPARIYTCADAARALIENGAALTGAVRCRNARMDDWNTYVPIQLDEAYAYLRWEYSEKTLSAMDAVYAYDPDTNTIARLRVDYAGDGVFLLYRADGELYGRITEIDKNGVFSEE